MEKYRAIEQSELTRTGVDLQPNRPQVNVVWCRHSGAARWVPFRRAYDGWDMKSGVGRTGDGVGGVCGN